MSPFSEKQGFVSTYVGFVRDHWRLIGSTAILVAALAAVAVSQQREQYRTSIQVLFRETTIGQQVAGVPIFESPQANSTAGSEMTTNVTLLGSESVAKDVIRKLGLRTDAQVLLAAGRRLSGGPLEHRRDHRAGGQPDRSPDDR